MTLFRSFFSLLGVLALVIACSVSSRASADTQVGSTTAAVVGGWAATPTQIYATVEIRSRGAGSGFCTGTLISPRLVLTAAHCVVGERGDDTFVTEAHRLEVAAGHLQSRAMSQAVRATVERVAVHDHYDHAFVTGRNRSGAGAGGIGSPNDIALLILSTPIDAIPTAPLLPAEELDDTLAAGDIGFVAGYGVYDLEEDLAGELHISDAIIDRVGSQELLTARPDAFGDSCFGDSGGPLYLPMPDGDYLIGVVSRGRTDVRRDCGDGGVYTLVPAYTDWIRRAAGEAYEAAPSLTAISFWDAQDPDAADAALKAGAGASGCAVSSLAGPPSVPSFSIVVFMVLTLLRWRSRR